MNQTVNLRFRDFRNKKGLKQKELAEMLGCTPSNISDIEKRSRGVSSDMLVKLCELFPDLNADWLLKGDGTMLTSDAPSSLKPRNEVWEPDADIKSELKQRMKDMEKKYTDLGQDIAILNYVLGKSKTPKLAEFLIPLPVQPRRRHTTGR